MIEDLPCAKECKEYVTYAESCAKSEELRLKQQSSSLNEVVEIDISDATNDAD